MGVTTDPLTPHGHDSCRRFGPPIVPVSQQFLPATRDRVSDVCCTEMEVLTRRQNCMITVEGVLGAVMAQLDATTTWQRSFDPPVTASRTPHYADLPVPRGVKHCIEAAEEAWETLRQRWAKLYHAAWRYRVQDVTKAAGVDLALLHAHLIRTAATVVDAHHALYHLHHVAWEQMYNVAGGMGEEARLRHLEVAMPRDDGGWGTALIVSCFSAIPTQFGKGFSVEGRSEDIAGQPYGTASVQYVTRAESSWRPQLTRRRQLTAGEVAGCPRVSVLRGLEEKVRGGGTGPVYGACEMSFPPELWEQMLSPVSHMEQGCVRAASRGMKAAVDSVQRGLLYRPTLAVERPDNHLVRFRALQLEGPEFLQLQGPTAQVVEDLISGKLMQVAVHRSKDLSRLDALERCKQLKVLMVEGCGALQDIAAITQLKDLEELSLRGCCNAHGGYIGYRDLVKLTSLDLSYTATSDLLGLEGTTSLRKLWMQGCATPSNLNPIRENVGLKLLDISKTNFVDLAGAREFTHLRQLFMGDMLWGEQREVFHHRGYLVASMGLPAFDLSFLGVFPELEELDLRGFVNHSLLPTQHEVLGTLCKLRVLILAGVELGAVDFLAGLPALELLDLSDSGDFPLAPLANCSKLHTLKLNRRNDGDPSGRADFEALAALTSLVRLEMRNQPLAMEQAVLRIKGRECVTQQLFHVLSAAYCARRDQRMNPPSAASAGGVGEECRASADALFFHPPCAYQAPVMWESSHYTEHDAHPPMAFYRGQAAMRQHAALAMGVTSKEEIAARKALPTHVRMGEDTTGLGMCRGSGLTALGVPSKLLIEGLGGGTPLLSSGTPRDTGTPMQEGALAESVRFGGMLRAALARAEDGGVGRGEVGHNSVPVPLNNPPLSVSLVDVECRPTGSCEQHRPGQGAWPRGTPRGLGFAGGAAQLPFQGWRDTRAADQQAWEYQSMLATRQRMQRALPGAQPRAMEMPNGAYDMPLYSGQDNRQWERPPRRAWSCEEMPPPPPPLAAKAVRPAKAVQPAKAAQPAAAVQPAAVPAAPAAAVVRPPTVKSVAVLVSGPTRPHISFDEEMAAQKAARLRQDSAAVLGTSSVSKDIVPPPSLPIPVTRGGAGDGKQGVDEDMLEPVDYSAPTPLEGTPEREVAKEVHVGGDGAEAMDVGDAVIVNPVQGDLIVGTVVVNNACDMDFATGGQVDQAAPPGYGRRSLNPRAAATAGQQVEGGDSDTAVEISMSEGGVGPDAEEKEDFPLDRVNVGPMADDPMPVWDKERLTKSGLQNHPNQPFRKRMKRWRKRNPWYQEGLAPAAAPAAAVVTFSKMSAALVGMMTDNSPAEAVVKGVKRGSRLAERGFGSSGTEVGGGSCLQVLNAEPPLLPQGFTHQWRDYLVVEGERERAALRPITAPWPVEPPRVRETAPMDVTQKVEWAQRMQHSVAQHCHEMQGAGALLRRALLTVVELEPLELAGEGMIGWGPDYPSLTLRGAVDRFLECHYDYWERNLVLYGELEKWRDEHLRTAPGWRRSIGSSSRAPSGARRWSC